VEFFIHRNIYLEDTYLGKHGLFNPKLPVFTKIMLLEQGIMEAYKQLEEEVGEEDNMSVFEQLKTQAEIFSQFENKQRRDK